MLRGAGPTIGLVPMMDMIAAKKRDAMPFLEWIKRGLAKPGKSGKDLARMLGVGEDIVSKMRTGKRQPKAEEIPLMEAYLGEPAPTRSNLLPPNLDFTDATSFDIVGWIEAGVLRVEPSQVPKKKISAPKSRKFPRARHYAYGLRDNS